MSAIAELAKAAGRRPSDRELVARCLSGDESAWSDLIDRYSRLIFSIPIRQGLSREEAADIFQAVCLDLVTELPKLRDPQALPAWLIRNTGRKVSRWRTRRDRYVPDEDDTAASLESTSELPEAAIEEVQRTQALREGIASLPDRCREMFSMLFFEEPARPYREVAERLGVRTGSIGFLRGRCLERLRAILERAGR